MWRRSCRRITGTSADSTSRRNAWPTEFGSQRLAEVAGEHAVARRRGDAERQVLLALVAAVALQRLDRHGVEVDDAAAAAGLRDADHLDAVDDGGGLVHGHRAAREVEVGPAEGDELAAAHAGQGEEAEHRCVAVAVDRARGSGTARPASRRSSPVPGRGRSVSDGALARRATLRVTRPVRSASLSSLLSAAWTWCTRAHRQATTAATAGAEQVGVQRVEVGGAELLQRRAAEPGQHVVRETRR